MGAFSFMPDPTADAFTPEQFMEQAYDQPFAKTDAFIAAGTSAVLESADLGTNLRNLAVPEGRINTIEKRALSRNPAGIMLEPFLRKPLNWALGSFGRETDEQLRARGEQPLTAEQYKASPSYRERVPYDDAMTASRAAALASFDDAKSVREEMARKAPWWVNLSGTAAGGALSPTNYIPVFGEAAAGASIGARVIRSGADAAVNVGVAGLLSAPTRAQYGDDISFNAQVSQIAMGAAIGGVFGAIGGAWAKRGAARDARTAAIRADAEGRLATIRNGQDSIATLREAATHLEQDGEINLGEASIDRLDALHDQAAAALPESAARVLETPEGYAARALAATMPDEVRTLAQHDAAIAENVQAVDAIKTELQDPRFDAVRQSDQQARELDVERQALVTKMEATRGADQRAQLAQQVKAIEAKIEAVSGKVDSATTDRYGALNRELAARSTEAKAIEKERAPVASKVETARQQHLADHAALPKPEAPVAPASAVETPRQPPDAPRPTPTVLATKPKPETVQPEATKAAAAVGKPDTGKTMAETYGVDQETGAIPEDYELKQLEKEGRLVPGSEDAKAMETANDNFETAKSWGEALRAAVACLI